MEFFFMSTFSLVWLSLLLLYTPSNMFPEQIISQRITPFHNIFPRWYTIEERGFNSTAATKPVVFESDASVPVSFKNREIKSFGSLKIGKLELNFVDALLYL
jgi:hypothetical protein